MGDMRSRVVQRQTRDACKKELTRTPAVLADALRDYGGAAAQKGRPYGTCETQRTLPPSAVVRRLEAAGSVSGARFPGGR